jgi:hypothetical protein
MKKKKLCVKNDSIGYSPQIRKSSKGDNFGTDLFGLQCTPIIPKPVKLICFIISILDPKIPCFYQSILEKTSPNT